MTKVPKCKSYLDEEVCKKHIGRSSERAGRTQIRIAETEKYPHVKVLFLR